MASPPHPVAVRSVACSPAGNPIAVTGGDDGKIRVWNLGNPDKLAEVKDAKEAEDKHSAAVGAIAFSPDGRFFASAAGREVFIWNATDLKETLRASRRPPRLR